MAALVDTSVLFAVQDAGSRQHAACSDTFEAEAKPLVPEVVLTELAYLLLRDRRRSALTTFVRSLAKGAPEVVSATSADYIRCAEILERYADSKIDFVDCMIAAIAERLNVTRILTLDQRHFHLFRPKHCDAFELLP